MIRKITKTGKKSSISITLALLLGTGAAWGQCTSCTTVLSGNNTVTPDANSTVCIAAGTTYSGRINVNKSGITICNSGTFAGTINYNANNSGLVINNLGLFTPNSVTLSSPATLNNGSSDGGATVVASASWEGYFGNAIGVAPVINNYASWKSQIQPLPGGTITNASGATWNAYLTTSADLAITNAGTWSSQIQEGGNSPTISIAHNAGSWTGNLGGGSGSLRLAVSGPWVMGFNFPSGAANALTTAAGTATTLNGALVLNGTVAIVNNGSLTLPSGMGTLSSTSSLTMGRGSQLAITGDLYTYGTLINQGSITVSHDFQNYAGGVVTGPSAAPSGTIQVANYTVNAGSFGADGSYLDLCDGTPPTPASNGFDVRGGTVGSNVTFCAARGPLPVVLTSFGAQLRQGQVVVEWATASELNNSAFVVERSADGRRFEALQTVAGHGTLATASTYAATDAQPLPGLSYYRLRQLDQDGTSAYSPVASVHRAVASFGAYPNPTPDALTLDLRALPAGPYTLRLLSLPGQVLLSQTLAGGEAQPISLAHLPAGTYLLEVAAATQGRSVQRIVKR
jgi:hypothetical protein